MAANASMRDLRDALRNAGLRATASRIAVLRHLRAANRPLSHAEVVEALQEEAWDRATLYRNLTDLAQAGLARKLELGDHVFRFDVAAATASHDPQLHPHFLCTVCGTVACLPETAVTVDAAALRSAHKRDVEVQLRGVCDACTP